MTQLNPRLIYSRRNKIGNVFKISASATAIHPTKIPAEIKWFGSRSYIDQNYADVYQNFFEIVDAKCLDDNMDELASQVDVIFTATPQGLCASLVNEGILSRAKVIDLSADFRIKDVKVYELSLIHI